MWQIFYTLPFVISNDKTVNDFNVKYIFTIQRFSNEKFYFTVSEYTPKFLNFNQHGSVYN